MSACSRINTVCGLVPIWRIIICTPLQYPMHFSTMNQYCTLNSLPVLMSLGTGAIRGWWGPHENTRHSREIPWQPCKQEPALRVATNQHLHTEGTSVEKPAWATSYEGWGGVGRAGCWIGKISDQSSDSQSSTEQANCKINMATKAMIHRR